MKNKILIIGLLIFVFSQLSCKKPYIIPKIEIGEIVTDVMIKKYSLLKDTEYSVMTTASSLKKGYKLLVDDIEYSVAVDDNNRIIYITTSDIDFKTPEGISIDKSTYNDALKHTSTGIVIEGGMARCYIPLNSGWNAVVEEIDFIHFIEIPLNNKVIYLFKKKSQL